MPKLRSLMVLRTARRGRNRGSQFWGCPSYPGCTGTRSHATATRTATVKSASARSRSRSRTPRSNKAPVVTPPAIAPPPSPADAPRPPPSERRIATVRQAAERWKAQLIDTGGRNRLLYYRPFKASTLEVSPDRPRWMSWHSSASSKGAPRSSDRYCLSMRTLPDLAKRARNIFRKARENLEERGIDTLFLGGGQANLGQRRSNTRSTCSSNSLDVDPHRCLAK